MCSSTLLLSQSGSGFVRSRLQPSGPTLFNQSRPSNVYGTYGHSSSPATDRNPAVRLARAQAKGRLHAKNGKGKNKVARADLVLFFPKKFFLHWPRSRSGVCSPGFLPQRPKYCVLCPKRITLVPAADRNPAAQPARENQRSKHTGKGTKDQNQSKPAQDFHTSAEKHNKFTTTYKRISLYICTRHTGDLMFKSLCCA